MQFQYDGLAHWIAYTSVYVILCEREISFEVILLQNPFEIRMHSTFQELSNDGLRPSILSHLAEWGSANIGSVAVAWTPNRFKVHISPQPILLATQRASWTCPEECDTLTVYVAVWAEFLHIQIASTVWHRSRMHSTHYKGSASPMLILFVLKLCHSVHLGFIIFVFDTFIILMFFMIVGLH